MQYSLLVPTNCSRKFLLLGYPLLLSPSEAELLHRLLSTGELPQKDLTKTKKHSLSVCIFSINQKAYRISGRRLILWEGDAYRINPYL